MIRRSFQERADYFFLNLPSAKNNQSPQLIHFFTFNFFLFFTFSSTYLPPKIINPPSLCVIIHFFTLTCSSSFFLVFDFLIKLNFRQIINSPRSCNHSLFYFSLFYFFTFSSTYLPPNNQSPQVVCNHPRLFSQKGKLNRQYLLSGKYNIQLNKYFGAHLNVICCRHLISSGLLIPI